MTNNDELALKLESAAEKASGGEWVRESGEGWEAICSDDDQVNGGFIICSFQGNDDESNRKFVQGASPANILALLAERHADKKLIALNTEMFLNADRDIAALRQRIRELETVSSAAEKLVRCKGRYHSEQNYRALAALFGVSTPDLPPIEAEARTVSVKLPESVIDSICLTAAEIHNLGRGVSDERAQEIINSIRCAAGIKLEVGE